jgi:hypothetical protein
MVSVVACSIKTQVCTCAHLCLSVAYHNFQESGLYSKISEFGMSEVNVLFVQLTVGLCNKLFSAIKFRRLIQDFEDCSLYSVLLASGGQTETSIKMIQSIPNYSG